MMYNDIGDASSGNASTPRIPHIPYQLVHHRQVQHPTMIPFPAPLSQPSFSASGSGGGGGAADDDDFPRRDERFPQWGNQETRDLIAIRAQLEGDFTAAKRNKNLWEVVAKRMREQGYRRTSEQCKCKWKNLVSRFRGQEASEVDKGRQFPFFDELHAVFTARANRMQQTQLDTETDVMKGRKRLKNVSGDQSHDGSAEQENEEEETEVDQAGKERTVQKRKAGKEKRQEMGENENNSIQSLTNASKNEGILNSLREMMRNFIMQQQRIDMQWRESMEKHAKERELFEEGWRQKMEKLERERLMMEQAWREREEQRRLREESRAERRDVLLTTLLNKLIHDDNP